MQRDREKPAMEVRNLSFAYGKNRVLQDISLTVEEGKNIVLSFKTENIDSIN